MYADTQKDYEKQNHKTITKKKTAYKKQKKKKKKKKSIYLSNVYRCLHLFN